MTTITYQEWRWQCAALREVFPSELVGIADPSLEVLWDAVDYGMAGNETNSCHWVARMAKALGLDKRRRLEWVGEDDEFEGHAVDERIWWSAQLLGRLRWKAGAWTDQGVQLVTITGFPTREDAINALERVLGRSEFDHLFAERKADRQSKAWREGE